MLFVFHIARGKWAGSTITSHQITATKALRSIHHMARPGCTPRIEMRDIEMCLVAEDFWYHSPTNDEMVDAAETIASHFWRELRHCVDVTVELLENN